MNSLFSARILSLIFLAIAVGCSSGSGSPGAAGGSQDESTDEGQDQKLPISATEVELPSDGTYGLGSTLEFHVVFPQNLTVTGGPRLILTLDSGLAYANYSSGSGTTRLTFQYQVAAGDLAQNGIQVFPNIDLNSGELIAGPEWELSLNLEDAIGETQNILIETSFSAPAQVSGLTIAPSANTDSLSLAWPKPSSPDRAITHYLVQYRLAGVGVWNSSVALQNFVSIASLVPGQSYEFRVAASNGLNGPYSEIQSGEIFNIMSFSPIVWLDSADPNGNGQLPADQSRLGLWVDKTGSAENAIEPDPNRQPLFQASIQNGLPAIRFENLDRGLQGQFVRQNGTHLTLFIVGQYDSDFTDRCMFEFLGPNNARAFFIDRRYAGNTFYNPPLTKGQFNLWRIQNSGPSSTVTENRNQVLYSGTNDFNTNFVGTGHYSLGDDSTGDNRMTGFIGEILIFDSQLSAEDVAKIETYLSSKWGL